MTVNYVCNPKTLLCTATVTKPDETIVHEDYHLGKLYTKISVEYCNGSATSQRSASAIFDANGFDSSELVFFFEDLFISLLYTDTMYLLRLERKRKQRIKIFPVLDHQKKLAIEVLVC